MFNFRNMIRVSMIAALMTTAAASSSIVSDDFSTPNLNSPWTVVNPLGDGTCAMTGTQLTLTVPAGEHAVLPSGNNSLRIMQPIDNTNFTAEVKFESALSAPVNKYVIEGVLVEQSATQYLRFDFGSSVNATKMYIGYFNGSSQTTKLFKTLYASPTAPLHMRIQRSGSTWTVSHSADGANWTSDTSFSQALTVSQIGPFVSNEGANAPAFTAIVDYFFNTAAPISPEDTHTLAVSTSGSGSVTTDPALTNYPAATTVTLTAVPVDYWGFAQWTGDLSGSENPKKLFMSTNKTVGATFEQFISTPSVTTTAHTSTISWTSSRVVTTRIDYGPTSSYGQHTIDDTSGSVHDVVLSGLDALTTYHYRITSTDANGNSAQSPDLTFTTAPEAKYALTVNVTGQGSVSRLPDHALYESGTIVALTAAPAAGWRFKEWSGDAAGMGNPASITMESNKTIGAAFERLTIGVDEVSATTDTARIAWSSNFPMTGAIDYGRTNAYELGSESDSVIGTTHSTTLAGLDPGFVHHYRIRAMDGDGNTTQTGDLTFATQAEAGYVLTVNIDGQGIVARAPDRATYREGTSVTLTAAPAANWRFSGWGGALGGLINPTTVTMTTDTTVNATFEEMTITVDSVVVTTDSAQVAWSTNFAMAGRVDYGITKSYGQAANAPDLSMSHTVALSGLAPGTTYHYRIVATDSEGNSAQSIDLTFTTAAAYTLAVTVTGQGTVARAPDQASYGSGASVTLTALPAAGWRFSGWSGALGGMTNPTVVAITTDTLVGALFEQILITVDSVTPTTNTAHIAWSTNFPTNGRVAYGLTDAYELGAAEDITPGTSHSVVLANLTDGITYHYRVTATDSEGNTKQTGDLTFTTRRRQYTLTVDVTGQGSVLRMPNWAVYNSGTSVTLTATAAGNWRFSGYSGALSGMTNPATLTINANTTVGALFEQFVITVTSVSLTSTTAQISWSTNFPSTGRVEYGLTTSYEMGQASSSQLGLQHTVTIPGIDTGHLHHYRIVATDEYGSQSTTPDQTMILHGGAIVSDDFSHGALDPSIWTFINPLNDGSCSMNGTQLLLSVPQGTSHDLWSDGIKAPRVMQAVSNGDFGAEIKFESLPTLRYQMQGVLVEQDATHHLRFEFLSDGTRLYVYVAYITNTAVVTRVQQAIAAANPMWMHITRAGDDWLMEYSSDGTNWTAAGFFTQAFNMTAIGPYVGNYNGPAFTAVVDYFFNDATPIVPEDASGLTLTTSVSGKGSVLRTPNRAVYSHGELVQIQAVADPLWRFTGWTGDTTGTLNPVSVTITRDLVVTAQFQQFIVDPHAAAAQDSATIRWTTPVPATGRIEYGLTAGYGSIIETSALTTTHSLTLSGLAEHMQYHYRITSADASGRSTTSADTMFTTGAPSNIVSDDFYGSTLKPVWTFINPTGDGSIQMNGTQAQITVASGAHELWTTGMLSPRLVQPAANTNFEIEAKFESPVTVGYHEQGIFIQESPTKFIRIEHYHDDLNPHFMVATIQNGTADCPYDQIVPTSMPLWIRVQRIGDAFTVWYRTGASDWVETVTFNYPMIVTAVGPYSGTYGPAHTALVDYFFNNDSPIVPEDNATYSLVVNVSGNGTVTKAPDRATYHAGDVVTLTATPADSATIFTGWSGALNGTQNPVQITIQGNTTVTANFAPSGNTAFDLWYGDTQTFGQNGKPQVWADVLGTVSDGDGLASLSYSLNGGAQNPLSIGSDGRRLQGAGDFIVQIPYSSLTPGVNTIVLRGVDAQGNVSTKNVTANYIDGSIPSPDLDIDWDNVANLQDVVQPVDGRWISTAAGAKNISIGYDRLIDIGDMNWTDYEITVPITVHSWNPSGVGGINGYPGAGFILRWNGHTNDPPVATQPLSGWNPFGNVVWYRWDDTGGKSSTFEQGNLNDSTGAVLQYNVTYMYKVRIETVPGQGTLYSKKVWRASDPEPADWTRQAYGATDVAHGSILFIAHWTQMTVGDITIRSTVPPFNTIAVDAGSAQARIDWQTSQMRSSIVDYGLTTAYELGRVSDSALTTSHSLTLTGLTPATLYHYRLSGQASDGTSASSGDLTFSTASAQTIRSDNFNATTLDTSIWTFVNPLGDATSLTMTGSEAQIFVPGGIDHDAWTLGNRTGRLMQPSTDGDFQIEAKFNATLASTYQFHGLIVEQDIAHYLRFDVVRMGANTNAFCAWMSGATASTKLNKVIDGSAPLYLRVTRSGQTWTFQYSHNGTAWIQLIGFTQAMTVTKVGVLVGNAEGSRSPAFTGRIDYFNNTAAPAQN